MPDAGRIILLAVVVCAVGVGVGVIIGYFAIDNSIPEPKENPDASQMIMNEIKAENLEKYLRYVTEYPHIAGRDVAEEYLVNYIADQWKESGLDVEIHPYEVLLSYPDDNDPNYLAIKLADGSLTSQSQLKEEILDHSQNKSGVVNPFNAYSAKGDPEAINHAELYNCSGLILYSDPKDYTVLGREVYPDDWFLPGTGAQRGSIQLLSGDELTPHYPAIETAWRLKLEDTDLVKIPVTPIGYNDAKMYLEKLSGNEVLEDWKGGLNITYRYGPGFVGEHSTSKMKMHVNTTNEMAITKNVVGIIRGSVEPDRYIIIGNHRDAWVFGSVDPSSGTAGVLEIARSFGEAIKNGWKPRRSIVFCSWGAEEYGLIGSTEWVEEFTKVLGSRTIAYLNIDGMINGNYTVQLSGSHNLKQLSVDSAKTVPNPSQEEIANGRKNTFDTWLHTSGGSELKFATLGSGNDYAPFLQVSGISVLNLKYASNFNPVGSGVSGYPVYHTVYETFDYMKAFIDPDFLFHQATARVGAEIARRLADSPLLPFKAVDYVTRMISDKNTMMKTFGEKLESHNIKTDMLNSALTDLNNAAKDLHKRIEKIDLKDPLLLRAVNDQLMQFERAFIDKQGIEGRNDVSHVIYTPLLHNSYGAAAFPGLVDSMFEIESDPNQEARWDEVRRQYSILLYHIGSAASTVRDFTPIKGFSNQ
uniref:putative N-acetylated-alpha-linked acidic dipeptidase n=1 Tax=Styela clava TaxID=7725 RepID=UPI00193A5190|nr:putative N-acetylated-alpha-linked acidic dipeptidase [Styela clava]